MTERQQYVERCGFRWARVLGAMCLAVTACSVASRRVAAENLRVVYTIDNAAKVKQLLGNKYPLLKTNTDAAARILAGCLAGKGTIDVAIVLNNSYSQGYSETGQWMNNAVAYGVMDPGALYEARTGSDPNGNAPDVKIMVAEEFLQKELWLDPSGVARDAQIPSDKVDFISFLLHETVHGLGFSGFRVAGNLGDTFTGGKRSIFDYLSHYGQPGVLGSLSPETLGFFGPRATAHHGGPIPISGGNGGFYHLGSKTKIKDKLSDDLMAGVKSVGRRKSLSQLDIAILEDLGWKTSFYVADLHHQPALAANGLTTEFGPDDSDHVDPSQAKQKESKKNGGAKRISQPDNSVPSGAGSGQVGVEGRVFALDETGKLLGVVAGATIELKDQAGHSAARVTSDAAGTYRADLPPGTYFYKVTADGYKDEDQGRAFAQHKSDGYSLFNFSLVKGENPADRQPPKIPTVELGELFGRVVEETGDGNRVGVPGAVISLRNGSNRKLTTIVAAAGQGKRAGLFRGLLEVADWRASVSAPGFETLVVPELIRIGAGARVRREFVLVRRKPAPVKDQGIRALIAVRPADLEKVPLDKIEVDFVRLPGQGKIGPTETLEEPRRVDRDLPPGAYRVLARAAGYVAGISSPAYVFPGRYTNVKLRLVPRAEDAGPGESPAQKPTILVRVLEETSQGRRPVDKAQVVVGRQGAARVLGITNAAGQATLELSAPGDYTAVADKPGYQQGVARATVNEHQQASLVITLERAATVPTSIAKLRVEVYEGRPGSTQRLPGAEVLARLQGQAIQDAKRATTSSDGTVELALPEPGTYTVLAQKADHVPDGQLARVNTSGPTLVRIYLRKNGGGMETEPHDPGDDANERPAREIVVLKGYVVYRDSTSPTGYFGVQGAKLFWTPLTSDRERGGYEATARRIGEFMLELPEGDYQVRIAPPDGYEPHEERVSVKFGMDAKYFILTKRESTAPADPLVNVRGYVVVRSRTVRGGFASVPNARVQLSGMGGSKTAVSDFGGRFTLSLPAGRYIADVTPPSGYERVRQVIIVRPGMEQQRIVLERSMSTGPGDNSNPDRPSIMNLTLQVYGQSGRGARHPLRGAMVNVQPAPRRAAAARTTDAFGRVTFQLPPGRYQVAARLSGYRAAVTTVPLLNRDVRRELTLVEEETGGGNVPVPSPKPVIVHVSDARTGRALAADVRILAGYRQLMTGRAGPNGQYSTSLKPGTYRAEAHFQGFQNAGQSFQVTNRSVEVNIRLQPDQPVMRERRLIVRITDRHTNRPLPADLRLVLGPGQFRTGKAGANGQYQTTLKPGRYTIQIHHPHFKPEQRSFVIGGQDVVLNIPMQTDAVIK